MNATTEDKARRMIYGCNRRAKGATVNIDLDYLIECIELGFRDINGNLIIHF
jgi:hypothetical protein